MDAYKYDHVPRKHWVRYALAFILSLAILIGLAVALVMWANSRAPQIPVIGGTTYVPQQSANQARKLFDEATYTVDLPKDWKVIPSEAPSSVEWQSTLKGQDNRTLTVYTDNIPTTEAVTRELPVTANGNELSYGELSDDCNNFTQGGSPDASKAVQLKPAPSVWQGVNFICNLPQAVPDDGQIGTGSSDGINTIFVTGPTKGMHSYFFLYIDHNIQHDYTILYGALQTFRAK